MCKIIRFVLFLPSNPGAVSVLVVVCWLHFGHLKLTGSSPKNIELPSTVTNGGGKGSVGSFFCGIRNASERDLYLMLDLLNLLCVFSVNNVYSLSLF